MKFTTFKEFRRSIQNFTLDGVIEYLNVDMTNILRDLDFGLRRLQFLDNFESFLGKDPVTGKDQIDIAAGAEVKIRNEFRDDVPAFKLVVRGKDGAQDITDGDTEWDQNFVYLKNQGATAAKVKVLFLK